MPKKFHLELGEPHTIVQGAVGDQAWGHYQFPTLDYTDNGHLIASWSYGDDAIDGKHHDGGVNPPFISLDGGRTWEPNNGREKISCKWKMPDGRYFLGFEGCSAYPVEYLEKYTPGVSWNNGSALYYAADIEETQDTTVRARIYDPVTDTVERYEPKVNWPYMPLMKYWGKRVYPVSQAFALCNCSILVRDGILYILVYNYGFDSQAKSREESVMKYSNLYSVYVLSSEDSGRTWNYLSQISVDEDMFDPTPGFHGPGEPMMDKMPDGSFVMLIRTGSKHKSYITRSADGCRTWTKPAVFDEIGVLPQILTLGCGVTLAGYGRPDLRLRATGDPAGMVWEDPIRMDIYGMKMEDFMQRSCFYTKFLPVDDHTALWAYTDFQYPNADGEPARAVLVRTVTVVED